MTLVSSTLEKIANHAEEVLPKHYVHVFSNYFDALKCQDIDTISDRSLSSEISLLSQSVNEIDDLKQHMRVIGDLYLSRRANAKANGDAKIDIPSSLTLFVIAIIKKLDMGDNERLAKALVAAAMLGDLPNHNPFHSNDHFRDITATVLRMCNVHNDLVNMGEIEHDALTSNDICLMLIAACIHDFCHDGCGNTLDGVHIPMRLEKRAFSMAQPVLKLFDLSDEELKLIEMMILCTDVSYGDKGYSPSRILNKFYKYHFEANDLPNITSDDYSHLADYLKDHKKTVLMAMMLEEADIFTSVGLSYEYAKLTTTLVAAETDILRGTPSTLHGFIEMICHGLISSPAAQFLFSEPFDKIYKQVSKDVHDNHDYVVNA